MVMGSSNYWPFDDYPSEARYRSLMRSLVESQDGGVAFFGAGASFDAGFPTWAQFHRDFLEHFGVRPSPNVSGEGHVVLSDFEYCINQHPEGALEYIKETFGRTPPFIPGLVKWALEARSLNYFYTTNFDEILHLAALGKSVAVYPNFVPMSAKYVYLHGRASIANSATNDLVIGTRGYQLAYDASIRGSSRSKIRNLSTYPVIFIGFSLDDPAVVQSLYEITNAAKFLSLMDPSASEGGESIAPLHFYVLLLAPKAYSPQREEEKSHKERRLKNFGVNVIWYQDGGEPESHRAALEVVQRLVRESRGLTVSEQEPELVERLLDAEELALRTSPTLRQAQSAKALLDSHPRVATVFFEHVNGLEWFRALRDLGALEPRSSTLTMNGRRYASTWLAAPFLQRIAAVDPIELADFLLTINTDNWVAIRQSFTLLQAMDDASGEVHAAYFAMLAVEKMGIDHRLLLELARAVRQLEIEDKQRTASALLQHAIQRLPEANPTVDDGAIVAFREIAPPILARSETGLELILSSLEDSLVKQFGSPVNDNIRFTRPAIEAHRMDLSEGTVLGLLIDLARETLLRIENTPRRIEIVQMLLTSEWPTKRRIGVAHCFLLPSDLQSNEHMVITEENLKNPHLFHELAKLLQEAVGNLSVESTEILRSFLADLHNGDTVTESNEYAAWAAILPEDLLPAPPSDLELYSEPESRLFRDYYVGRFTRPIAPLDSAEFSQMASNLSPEQLLDLVRDPISAGVRVTLEHDSTAMWDLLAEYVKGQDSLSPILIIATDDFDRDGILSLIGVIPEIARDDPERWGEVFNWAIHMLPDLGMTQFSTFSQLVEDSAKQAPIELVESISTLALRVAGATKRTSVEEMSEGHDDLIRGYLNYPSGKAVQALFDLILRELPTTESIEESVQVEQDWFTEKFLEPITHEPMALGIDAWIGVGRHYALLLDSKPEPISFVSAHIKSESSEPRITASAFWSGYLWAPSVWSNALEELRDAYGVNAIVIEQDSSIEEDLKERFFQHIVIGVLRNLEGYEDILLSTLYDGFTPETRGAIAFALGCGLQEASEGTDVEFRARARFWFIRYWKLQATIYGGQDGTQLAKYLRWLRYLGLPPHHIEEPIEVSLAQVRNSFDVDEVFTYLESYVEVEPAIVLSILDKCVEWYRLHGDFWLDGERVRNLLNRLAGPSLDRNTFREVGNGFAELGALSTDDLRGLLEIN